MLGVIGEVASVAEVAQLARSLVDKIAGFSSQGKTEETKRQLLTDKATDLMEDLQKLSEQNGNSYINDRDLKKIKSALEAILGVLNENNVSSDRGSLAERVKKRIRFPSIIEQLDDAKRLLDELNWDTVRKVVISTETRMPKFPVCVPSIPPHIVESESMKAILDFLKEEEAGIEVRVVGIYGEGGMGKTTLLNWAVARLWEQTNSMVMPYVEVGQNPDLEKLKSLQSSIVQQLGSSEFKLQSIYHGHTLIKQQLDKVRESNKKVCLAIDNVWKEEDLTKLLPSNLGSCLPSSSCILLTTRFLDVVDMLDEISKPQTPGIQNRCKFRGYDILQLSEADATQLFRKRAILSEGNHEELVKNVVGRCGGLPLLLEVLGAHFSSEPKRRNWKEFVEKMDSTNERPKSVKKVEEVLKYSYDWMSPDTQKAFVDVARYFHEWDWDTVSSIVGKEEIEELKNSCLLKEVNSTRKLLSIHEKAMIPKSVKSVKCVKMHDLVLSLGRSLAEGNRLQTDRENRFNLNEYADSDLHQIEGFWNTELFRTEVIGADVLGKMQNLRVLSTTIDHAFPPLRSLRYLSLHCSDGAWEMPMEKCQQLSVLSLTSLAWDFSRAHFPAHLRQLHLHRCHGLVELPMDSFKKLEVLHLHGCNRLQRLSVTIGNFKRLLKLEVIDAPSFVELPSSICKDLGELKFLRFWNCPQLANLPDVKWNLKSLTGLYFEGCRLTSLPIGELASLEVLSLANLEHLEILPRDFAELHGLRKLSFAGCKNITSLPETLGKLSSLERLVLERCESLARLPAEVGELKALTHLILTGCLLLQNLPPTLGDLESLKCLTLKGCKLLELPKSIGSLKGLSTLNLDECEELKVLPEGVGKLTCLEHLQLMRCKKLLELPENIGSLKGLSELDLSGCEELKELPESFGKLTCLKSLYLCGCKKLLKLPENIGSLKGLSYLNLSGCEELKELPESFGKLSCLETLRIQGCRGLVDLPELAFRLLGSLGDVRDCTQLARLPDWLWAEVGNSNNALEFLGSWYGLKGLRSELRPSSSNIIEALPQLTGLPLEGNIDDEAPFTILGKATALNNLSLRDDTGGHVSHEAY